MPFFSFVIPTRNRARYLEYALRSCMQQEFDDYEIVVSDNNSSDHTAELVKQLDNGKIRYFNTGRDLGLTDNFENGLTKVSGDYVLYLADDEAYIPSTLTKLKYWIDKTDPAVISYGRTPFAFPGVERRKISGEENTAGVLELRPFTRKVARIPSEIVLKYIFSLIHFDEGYYGRVMPVSVKSIVRRDVVEEILKTVGRFHLHPIPDWSSAVMMLNYVKDILLVDQHFLLAGEIPESTGPKFKKTGQVDNGTAREYVADLTPLKTTTLTNLCANAMLQGQAAYPARKRYELDYARYFRLIENDLRLLQSNGVDVEKDFAELEKVSKQYGIPEKVPEEESPAGFSEKVYSRLKKFQQLLFPHKEGHYPVDQWPIVIDGKTAGFNNILECAHNYNRITADIQPDEHVLSLFQVAYGSYEVIE